MFAPGLPSVVGGGRVLFSLYPSELWITLPRSVHWRVDKTGLGQLLVISRSLGSGTGGICPSLERAECVCEADELDLGNEPPRSIQTFFWLQSLF